MRRCVVCLSGQCQSTVTHSPLKLSEHALGAACRARLPTQPSTASRGSATCARRTICQSVCVCGSLWQSVRPPRTATLVAVDGDCPDTDRWLPGPTFKRHVYAFKRAYRRSSREQRSQRLNVQTIYDSADCQVRKSGQERPLSGFWNAT